jgi:6,7-dimethyl-8-ribityllumazine synthase
MSRHSPPPIEVSGAGLRIGIVHSRFNDAVVSALLNGCTAELAKLGVALAQIETASVPGALEIPLALQAMAQSNRFDALVALGCVIRGETYHFEIVSNDSCRGVMEVSLEAGLPIANGILTVENDAQARERAADKGADCARAAVEMALLCPKLRLTYQNTQQDKTLGRFI